VYNIPNRIFNFTVSRPDFTAPFIYSYEFTPTDDGFTLSVTVSAASTIYYFMGVKDTPLVDFADIKAKVISYDYYTSTYIMGEFIEDK
jgi:hypothetical protein